MRNSDYSSPRKLLVIIVATVVCVSCSTASSRRLTEPKRRAPIQSPVPIASVVTSAKVSPPASVPAEPEFNATVDFAADGTALVDLTIPLAWYRSDLEWIELEHFKVSFDDGRGYERFLVVDKAGAKAPWSKRIAHPGKTLHLRYSLTSGAHLARPKTGIDEVPHPVRGGFYHTGRALFPLAVRTSDGKTLDAPLNIKVRLPKGKKLITSLDLEEPNPSVLYADSLSEAVNSVFYVGNFSETQLGIDRAELHLVTSDFDANELAPYFKLARRMLHGGGVALGDANVEKLLVIIDRHPHGGVDGGVTGRGISVLVPEPPTDKALTLPGAVLVHELAHLWNRADKMWLGEGYTRYLEITFRAKLDEVNEARALDEFMKHHQRYVAGSAGAAQEATGSAAYSSGAMVSFCLDAFLRKDGHSIFEAHRLLRAKTPKGQPNLRAAAFQKVVDELSPAIGKKLQRWLSDARIDMDPCFKEAGYRVAHRKGQGLQVHAPSGVTFFTGEPLREYLFD